MRKLIATAVLALSPAIVSAQGGARTALINADAAVAESIYRGGMAGALHGALGAEGALVWPGAGVMQGQDVIARFFARQPLMNDAKLFWQPFRIEVAADTSLALIVGVATIDRAASDPFPVIHRIGRYLAAWKRVAGTWQLSALALVNLISPGETIWNGYIGPNELPLLRATGTSGTFIAADSAFAADAGLNGAAKAFGRWAAADATTFSLSGELNVGPDRISAILATNTSHWEWGAVAAGSSADGTLGWTVGQATITPAAGGTPSKSKYLTLWRKMADGTIRFIADGGNARP